MPTVVVPMQNPPVRTPGATRPWRLLPCALILCLGGCPQDAPDSGAFAGAADGGPGQAKSDISANDGAHQDTAVPDSGQPDAQQAEVTQPDTKQADIAPPDADASVARSDSDATPCKTAVDCDSGNPCMQDACNGGTCLHVPKDDFDSCGQGKQCMPGQGCVATVRGSTSGLAVGGSASCAVLNDGTLWCWGHNPHGQLGQGNKDSGVMGEAWPTPAVVAAKAVIPVSSAAVGSNATCAVSENGKGWCWGNNQWGQLGVGSGQTATSILIPLPILTGATFNHVAMAITHGCGLRTDGKVTCWGLGNSGQLGDGKGEHSKEPVLATGLPLVESVVVGESYSCARTSALEAWCWGTNGKGQLGDGKGGTSKWSNSPVKVVGVTNVSAVAAGRAHACARDSAGKVWCWGANGSGQLGLGKVSQPKTTPQAVALPFKADEIAAGHDTTCAYQLGGQVACWGKNDGGQLGVASKTKGFSATPLVIAGFLDLSEVVVGQRHACAIVNNGHAVCWGGNLHGQLGVGAGVKGSIVPKLVGQPPP